MVKGLVCESDIWGSNPLSAFESLSIVYPDERRQSHLSFTHAANWPHVGQHWSSCIFVVLNPNNYILPLSMAYYKLVTKAVITQATH